ncbi:uncharacterized protein [Antedon mediterranea]|uniref:uncharacterized protein n=1 Tax=Antedon mediterranea TaxID=105859 RepID=UPI003AF4FF4A
MSSQEVQGTCCQDHPDNTVERFCTTCTKRVCKRCIMSCYKDHHDILTMSDAIDAFNKQVTEVIRSAEDIKQELENTFHSIMDDKADFESHVKKIKEVIKMHKETIVSKVEEETKKLLLDLGNVCKQKNDAIEGQVKELESHQMELQSLKRSSSETMNQPEKTKTLDDFNTNINEVKKNVKEMNSQYLSCANNLKPNVTFNSDLDDALTKGLGEITSVDNRFIIEKDDRSITVSKGQTFEVKAESLDKSDTCKVAATLITPSGKQTATEVEHMGSGEYRIKGRCDKEGDWKMEITAGVAHFKGSPVNIKVEPLGLIDNIKIATHKQIWYGVSDVVFNSDSCILVSSDCNELLKFTKSGKFVANIKLAENAKVSKMHSMGNGHIVYSDRQRNIVVMLNDKFEECMQFGKKILKRPLGLTVNNKTQVLYVVDIKANCVCKFDIDGGSLLGKIFLENRNDVDCPNDVTLTREGHLLVTEWSSSRIQMINANGTFTKTLVSKGPNDGKVIHPCAIETDKDENIIVSSDNKVQLFDKNGVFLKRIDTDDDGLKYPFRIIVISNRPQTIAVFDYKDNNVKIFYF